MSGRRLLWVLLRWLARVLFMLAFRVRVFGQRNVPAAGGVLIVSNHQSYLDPILLALGLERSVSYIARRSLFRNFALSRLIRLLNAFPVSPGVVDTAGMREAVRRLRSGACLVVFAEGTRTRDGSIGPLMPGAAAIALMARVPIVPAAIVGAFEAWPRGGIVRPGKITVRYARLIPAEECAKLTRGELLEQLRVELLKLYHRRA